jgi:imidazolonepropionase-like amidohydrolase
MERREFLSLLAATGAAFTASRSAAQPAATLPPSFGPQQPPFQHSTPIAIVGGKLIDATGAPPRSGQTLLIDRGKIVRIGPIGSVEIPKEAMRFDAEGMTVMPGLIASNQHIQLNPLYPAPVADLPIAELRARWEGNFSQMPRKAYVYLMQGITSMRQTSGPWKRLLPVKKQIDAGELPGPRIFLGGALITSPEHFADYIKLNKTPPDAVSWLRNEFAHVVLDDIERDSEQLLGKDFNFWKLYLAERPFDGTNDFTDAQLRHIIEKAHKAGKIIDVHANDSLEGYARLLKFDINTLEHPFSHKFLHDEKTIEGFAKKGVIVDTLLRVRVAAAELLADPDRFDEIDYIMSTTPDEYRILMRYRDKMRFLKNNPTVKGLSLYDKRGSESTMFGQTGPSYGDQMKARENARENMRRFIKHKVKFSMGTDSTSFLNFQQENPCAREMADMVELGMTSMESIIASTRNGAEALGMLETLGTLEKGKIADVIVVAGDPLSSMNAMKRVAVVIKDGVRYK